MIWQFMAAVILSVISMIIMLATERIYLPYYIKKKNIDESAVEKKTAQAAFSVIAVISTGVFGYFMAGRGFSVLYQCRIISTMMVLVVAFITDMKLRVLSNFLMLTLLTLRVIIGIAEFVMMAQNVIDGYLNSLLAFVIALAALGILSAVTGGGIGAGDIKLFCGIGFILGIRELIYTFVISVTLCALFSLFLVITKKMSMKDTLPLGPFVLLGYEVAAILVFV